MVLLLLQIRFLACSPCKTVVLTFTANSFAILSLVWCLWLCRQQFLREQPAIAKHKHLYLKLKYDRRKHIIKTKEHKHVTTS